MSNRMFDILKKINNLPEYQLSNETKLNIINDFIQFVDIELKLNGNLPDIKLSYDSNDAKKMKSFGRFTIDDNRLLVVISNRNLADILRTLAHELVHHKQNILNKIKPNSNEDGSEIENEANALAAKLMRVYGRNNPIIFE